MSSRKYYYWFAWSETHRWLTCLIWDRHAWSETDSGQYMYFLGVSVGSPLRHVGLQSDNSVSDEAGRSLMGLRSGIWVSDEACRSAMGLWWSMSVSDGSPVRHVGLRWVSGSNNILVNSISNCFANFYLLNILANLGRKYNLNKKVEPDWGSPQLQFILMIVVLFYCCNY